jgi:DNA-binding protein HU-beta
MNRRELVLALSERLEVDRRAADTALATVVDVITENVAKGEVVSIPGFAKFARRDLPARTVRNNFTGEMVKRPASKKVRITPLKAFKDAAISGKVVKKAPATRATAKKTAAKKAPATRATAKKAPAKKAAAKATAKKAPATRATAKKAPVRKTAAKKAVARAR